VREGVENLDGTTLHGGTAGDSAAPERDRVVQIRLSIRRGVVARGTAQEGAVETPDESAFGLAEPDRVLGQRLEHRLQVERRAPDDLEQLAGRRLLLEGHAQLRVASVELREQAHVLQRDDGLARERAQQVHLTLGETSGLAARYRDRADGNAV